MPSPTSQSSSNQRNDSIPAVIPNGRLDQSDQPRGRARAREEEQEEENDGPSHLLTSEPGMQRFRKELRRITLNFTPSWFSVNMGTGITSILLHELPYQFRGLGIISNVIFGLNVLLFFLFLGISIARYTIWPKMLLVMLFHPTQSFFVGTFPMGLATIINMCALSATPAWGPRFATFTWVLWWIDAAISLIICIGLPIVKFTRHDQSFDKITAVWLLPVVTTVIAAASGSIVATILPPAHARLTLIVSYILFGAGLSLAFMIMALYYARLSIYKIPPAALIVSCFLPVGPCGQGAFALLKISSVLYDLSKSTGAALGSPSSATAEEARFMALAIYGVSIPLALFLWGLGLVWLSIAVYVLVDLWWVSKLSFNLGWWGFTFPLGTFCTATTQLGIELGSGGFRILGTILSLIEVLLWLFLSILTLVQVLRGKVFFSPCLAELGGEPPTRVPDGRKYSYEAREKTIASTLRSVSVSRSRSRTRVGAHVESR